MTGSPEKTDGSGVWNGSAARMTARSPGLLRRAVARGIDLLLYLLVLEVAGALKGGLPFRGMIVLVPSYRPLVELGIGFSTLMLYGLVAERIDGTTVGKGLLGLQVETVEGERPGWRAVILRNLALFVDLQIFGLVAYSAMSRSDDERRLGDLWAGTRVVRRGGPRLGRGPAVGLAVGLAWVLLSYVID